MVQQQSSTPAQQVHSSFDTMTPYERQQITYKISLAKHDPQKQPGAWDYDYNSTTGYYEYTYKDVITPQFRDAIVAEIGSEQTRIKTEREVVKKQRREQRTAQWDRYKAANDSRINEQPKTSHYSDETIGWRGYRWLSNFKADNGRWYAAYQPVRGGETRKYYSLSDNEWSDDYQVSLRCEACQKVFRSMSPIEDNVCPQCGAKSDRMSYRGRY